MTQREANAHTERMPELSDPERRCLRRVAEGGLLGGGEEERRSLASLKARGLIEERISVSLPLENQTRVYRLTSRGRQQLRR